MSSRGWKFLRLAWWSHPNFPVHDHRVVGGHFQKSLRPPAAPTSRIFASPQRVLSSSVINQSSDSTPEGPGRNDEAQSRREGSHGQDKDVPKGDEDRRMWRKWIEERLADFGTAVDGTDASSGRSSRGRENVKNSHFGAGTDASSGRSSRGRENVKNSHFGAGNGSARERSSSLDSIFGVSLRPSSVAPGNAEDSQPRNLRNPFRRENGRSSIFLDGELDKSANEDLPFLRSAPKRPSDASVMSGSSRQTEQGDLPIEAEDDFENRVLGSATDGSDSFNDEFLRDLDEIGRSARGIKSEDDGDTEVEEDEESEEDERAQSFADGAAANEKEYDLEDEEHPYRIHPDRLFFPGQTYDPEDLDISKEAGVEKPTVRTRKRFPAKEVHRIADFRNPRYLTSFIRESSRILPKRHFQLSGKAQRKVAREIKTARILGLMPFTSMGDPPFRFLRSRSDEDTYPRSDRF